MKRKKNILFHKLFTLFVTLIAISCFSSASQDKITVATISLTNFNCVQINDVTGEAKFNHCYDELNTIMKSIKGIKEYEMFIDTSHNHQVILINIVYNNRKTTIDIINNEIRNNGYTVVLEMKE